MEKMLTDLCSELNNYFPRETRSGTFTIENGRISGLEDFLQDGQYFRIIGSIFNDGVWKYVSNEADESLTNEVFEGTIWSMAIPRIVIDLSSEIEDWREKYENLESPMMSPYSSESFQNYSYSKGARSSGFGSDSSDDANSWQAIFASRLTKYRRLRNI